MSNHETLERRAHLSEPRRITSTSRVTEESWGVQRRAMLRPTVQQPASALKTEARSVPLGLRRNCLNDRAFIQPHAGIVEIPEFHPSVWRTRNVDHRPAGRTKNLTRTPPTRFRAARPHVFTRCLVPSAGTQRISPKLITPGNVPDCTLAPDGICAPAVGGVCASAGPDVTPRMVLRYATYGNNDVTTRVQDLITRNQGKLEFQKSFDLTFGVSSTCAVQDSKLFSVTLQKEMSSMHTLTWSSADWNQVCLVLDSPVGTV